MARKKQTSKGEPPEPADEHDQKLLADVGRHGWQDVGVEEDEEGPTFSGTNRPVTTPSPYSRGDRASAGLLCGSVVLPGGSREGYDA
jgi:hypothetical protein